MKENFKEKLIKKKQKTCGTLINMGDVCVSDILSRLGYDFLWLDFEHSYLSYEQILAHTTIAKANDTGVLVRVPQGDLTATKKVLEMGVDGIIFPMVKSVDDIKKMIDFSLYPPEGNRGFGPMGAIHYGLESAQTYVKSSNKNILLFIQIECVDVIKNLDEIMQIDAIDGYIFGPNDLSGSIGELLQVFDEKTTSLIKEAICKLKSKNKYIGLATGDMRAEVLKYWSEMGIDMLFAGADYSFIVDGGKRLLNTLKENHVKNQTK